jgi:hypothetical protein
MIIEKSKENPFGTHHHLSFKWGLNTPVGILYIGFSDKEQDFISLKIKSKWPKNVFGIKPVLDAVEEKIKKEDIGLPLVGLFPVMPETNQKYVFSGNSLEVDVDDKKCALYWEESIVTGIKKNWN